MSDQVRRKVFDTTEVRALGEGRRIRFVISTGAADRDNDTIDPAGWELSNFRRNPVVLLAHSRTALPVAKAVEVGVEGQRLVATAEFATHGFAEEVYQLYLGGFLRATSVGFRALEWKRNEVRGGIDFLRHELLEFSCVPIPANPQALVAAAAAGLDVAQVRAWAQRVLDDDDDPVVLELTDDDDGGAVVELTDGAAWASELLARARRRRLDLNPARLAGLTDEPTSHPREPGRACGGDRRRAAPGRCEAR
jgi:HK97 family phage prohead protease